MSLKAIDAVCLRGIVGREPVSFEFAGGIYTATTGARDTMSALVEGGSILDQELSILVPLENVSALDPKPDEGSVFLLCVDNDGIPCRVEDSVTERVRCRVTKIGRALAGLTYTLTTDQRG